MVHWIWHSFAGKILDILRAMQMLDYSLGKKTLCHSSPITYLYEPVLSVFQWKSTAALNNPSYHRFKKKPGCIFMLERLSNLLHSTWIVQASISYIFITLSSLFHCAMNADETHIFRFILPKVCDAFTHIWLLWKQTGHANSTIDVSKRIICICELNICASSLYLHFGTALVTNWKFKD